MATLAVWPHLPAGWGPALLLFTAVHTRLIGPCAYKSSVTSTPISPQESWAYLTLCRCWGPKLRSSHLCAVIQPWSHLPSPDFFYSAGCFQGSSVLHHTAGFCSFSCLYMIPSCRHTSFMYKFTSLVFFCLFATVNNDPNNILITVV